MRNFYRESPPPMRPYHHYNGPSRMPNYGYPPPPQYRYNQGRIPSPPGRGHGHGHGPGYGQKGASKIESFMETCNRLLATAQGFQPYIAQASPLFRNLPALWRLYKGFSSSPKDTEDEYEHESSEYQIESSSFEYVYKEEEHEQKAKHDHVSKDRHVEKHHFDKQIRHKFDAEHMQESHHKRGSNRFFPVRHERKEEPVVEKIIKPYKSKPSVPRIFQPPFNFDE